MQNIMLLITVPLLLVFCICFFLCIRRKKLRGLVLDQKISKKNFSPPDVISIKKITERNNLYKILIVEDDPVNKKILTSQLSSAKYKVIAVETGEDALKHVNNNKDIDLVLLDLILPDLSGFTVCRAIREKYTLFEKPVIMVTAKNQIKDLLEGFEVGANDFLTKPYNIYELIARINSSISLKRVVEYNTSLEKINTLKSEIMDMAAHDLKSPLTIISGYAKRIIKNITPNTIELENAKKILNSSDKMLTIINRLLEDSKYENLTLHFEKLNISELIKDSIEFYKDSASDKKQSIILESKNDNICLNVDKDSFTTIIDNLLSNAIKYSPLNSRIKVDINNDKDSVKIIITDKGNGFTKEEIKNLFVKYFPFSNKPTLGEASTGLGLSIIYNMVMKNSGTISVESKKGHGSKFILKFPKC